MPPAPAADLLRSIRSHAVETPDQAAFLFEGETVTYAAFDACTDRIAAAMVASNIAAGERIAYVGKNTLAYFLLLYGAMKAGAVVVPVNWRLAPPEITAILNDSRARLVLFGREFTFFPELADLQENGRILLAAEEAPCGLRSFSDWYGQHAPYAGPLHRAPGDIAIQLYTSGTTGLPKGVMLTHANLTNSLVQSGHHDLGWNIWSAADRALVAMPVSHISGSGYAMIALHHGATCHLQRQFDIELTFDALAQHRLTRMFLVPAALQMLVRHPRAGAADFSSLKQVGYGASPMPLALLRECIETMQVGFVQFYGMTETAGTVVALSPEDHAAALHTPQAAHRLRAAGRALPWVELRVVDATGRDVRVGTVGEIVIRSASNMAGYWQRDDETARTIDADGWLHTGDAATLDSDGYVFIHDRVKDMIISGGENVYPAEVESALADHPSIAEVAVIGVPDPKWGEAVKAIVVLRPGAILIESELIGWCRTRLAGFKSPSSVDFAESLPRNASGKLLKRTLRAPYWAKLSRQVN